MSIILDCIYSSWITIIMFIIFIWYFPFLVMLKNLKKIITFSDYVNVFEGK